MKTKLMIAMFALLAALCAAPAWAQTSTVRGKVMAADGQPLAGGTIEMKAKETGRKYTLKTDGKGNYFSIGIQSGVYDYTITKDGELLGTFTGRPVTLSGNTSDGTTVYDFDLAKERSAAEAKLSAEEKARREAAVRETQKVSGLNNMLAVSKQAMDAGNYDEAIRVMTQATQTDPTRDLLWANLGDAYLAAGKHAAGDRAKAKEYFEQAITAYTKAVEIKPTNGRYYNNLGDAQGRTGKADDAVKNYQLAAQNDPADAGKYYFNMGAVLTNTGKPEEANTAFDKAIAANPQYAEAYYQKAVNLMGKATVDKEGKYTAPPEVATNLNKYLELSPTGPNAQSAKDMLGMLGAKIETTYGTRKSSTPAKKK